jgi:hypothetical protein
MHMLTTTSNFQLHLLINLGNLNLSLSENTGCKEFQIDESEISKIQYHYHTELDYGPLCPESLGYCVS